MYVSSIAQFAIDSLIDMLLLEQFATTKDDSFGLNNNINDFSLSSFVEVLRLNGCDEMTLLVEPSWHTIFQR
jgi:hypothetical protein